MYDHDLDARVNQVARRQAGAFSLDQLRLAGGDGDAALHRIALGRWARLAPSVLAVTSFPGTFERQCWAAVLGEPVAAVGVFAAAPLLQFRGFRPGRPEIVVPTTANARSGLAVIHRYEAPALTTVQGLKITSRAQTLFDLASRISVQRLESTVDDELLRKRLSVDDLEERLAVYEGTRRAGLPVMRSVIEMRRADGWAPAASELERRGDRMLRRLSGRPTILAEVSFPWLKGGVGRVDRYLPEERIIVEFDGRRWHARLDDFDDDRWRDNQSLAAGLVTLRFTWTHLTTRPSEVLGLIESTRRSRRTTAA